MKMKLAGGLLLLTLARTLEAQQPQLGTRWVDNLTAYKLGRTVTVVCPPNGAAAKVWGSGPYTADSSVCTAAVHAGLLAFKDGGAVTAVIGEGRKEFSGSTRNGVTTLAYGEFPGSFTFAKTADGGQIDWNTTAKGLATSTIKSLDVICPSGSASSPAVYGTDIYTDDSSICGAAAHAGLIDVGKGGKVTIISESGLAVYRGSARNGISTQNYGSWPASFKFTGASVANTKPVSRYVLVTPVIIVSDKAVQRPYTIHTKPIVTEGKRPNAIVITTSPIITQ